MEAQQRAKESGDPKIEGAISAAAIVIIAGVVFWTAYVNHLRNRSVQLIIEARAASGGESARKLAEAASLVEKAEGASFAFQLTRRELATLYAEIAGELLNSKGTDFSLSERLCEKALSLNDDPKLRIKLARAYAQRQRYAEAIRESDKCLQGNPNNKALRKDREEWKRRQAQEAALKMASLGDQLLSDGKLDEAIAQYQRTIERYPRFEFLRLSLAKSYVRKLDGLSADAPRDDFAKVLDDALAAVQEIIRSRYPDVEALNDFTASEEGGVHYKLAIVHFILGAYDRAAAECKKRLAEDPNDGRAKQLMQLIERERQTKASGAR